jgi:serine carboxypeptidase-like clade 2
METVTFDAGLFDVTGSRRAREIMLRFRQLRGLRAVLDSGLASGSLTPGAAAALLVRTLAMSTAEASGEVAGALVDPVQMSSYVVGKSQILAFLALELAGGQGNVSVQAFNDRLETEGNLPVALQQHDRGVAVLPASFLNLHSAYPGVPVDRIEILASSPDRVRHLPGVPPSSADQPTPQMFSGYVNVNADRGLYYFLVHSVHAAAAGTSAPIDDPGTPVVIWLQGGNGCSSLVGAFSENGPFYSNDGVNLTPNPHGWHTIAHMLYLDRPAGAGYSFTRSKNYSSFANDRQTAEDSVALLRGVLQTHPWLCGRKVFVAGESYAGHFVAQLATLLTAATPALCVSLGGVLAGNAVVDINQTNFAWFENGASHSLVPTSTWADIKQSCDFEADLGIDGNGCPSPQTPTCHSAIELWLNQSGAASGALSLYDYYADACTPENADAIGSDAPCIDATTTAYLNQPSVRAALHVSPEAPLRWAGCSDVLNDAYNCTDTLQSVVPLYTALRNRGVAVLVYSGDADGIVPTKASERWVGLTGKATPWRQWSAGSVLAGYTYDVVGPTNHTTTVATVRGAGHMVPRFRGLAALALVSRFLSGDPL